RHYATNLTLRARPSRAATRHGGRSRGYAPVLQMPSPQPQPHAAPAPAAEVGTREILDVPVAMVDYDRAMDVMDALVERRERGYVCAAPVHAVMVAQDDAEMLAALRGSTLVVPDGMPLVWAS